MAKAQVIFRNKMELISAGIRPDSEAYERISKLPDNVSQQELSQVTLENASQTEMDLLEEFKFLICEGGRILGSTPIYDDFGTSVTRHGDPATVLNLGEEGDIPSLHHISDQKNYFRDREENDYDAMSSGDGDDGGDEDEPYDENDEEIDDDYESFAQDGDDSDDLQTSDDEKDSDGDSDEDSGEEDFGVL